MLQILSAIAAWSFQLSSDKTMRVELEYLMDLVRMGPPPKPREPEQRELPGVPVVTERDSSATWTALHPREDETILGGRSEAMDGGDDELEEGGRA